MAVTVLALDVSTKAGYAVLRAGDDGSVEIPEYGLVKLPNPTREYGEYPWSYLHASQDMARRLIALVDKVRPDHIVVEETNLGKQRYTQKLLEYLHSALLTGMQSYRQSHNDLAPDVTYMSSSSWRKALGLRLSNDDKKNNRRLSAAKKVAEMTGGVVDKAALGVKGKVGWKHVSVRFINEKFGMSFKQKDNDITDAICLGLAFVTAGAEYCTGED